MNRKNEIIAAIQAIYRRHGYQRQGRPWEDYAEAEPQRHWEKLQAGAYGWITGRGNGRSGSDTA